MAKSTAPILLIGGVTILNRTLELIELNRFSATKALEVADTWKVVAATGLAAGAFALLEKVNQPLTVGVAWVALVTTLLVGTDKKATLIERLSDMQQHPERYKGE